MLYIFILTHFIAFIFGAMLMTEARTRFIERKLHLMLPPAQPPCNHSWVEGCKCGLCPKTGPMGVTVKYKTCKYCDKTMIHGSLVIDPSSPWSNHSCG